MLTDNEIKEIEKRAAKATPGKWEKVSSLPVYAVCTQGELGVRDVVTASGREYARSAYHEKHGSTEADAEFIAHARTDIPALLADRRELVEVVRKLVEVVKIAKQDLQESSDHWCIKPICECYLCRALKTIADMEAESGEGK